MSSGFARQRWQREPRIMANRSRTRGDKALFVVFLLSFSFFAFIAGAIWTIFNETYAKNLLLGFMELVVKYDGLTMPERHQEIAEQLEDAYRDGRYDLAEPFVRLNPYGIAPLSAVARFETEVPRQISLTVKGRSGPDVTHVVEGFRRSHEVPILGLYADHDNQVVLTARSKDGDVASHTVTITTDPLPNDYPAIDVVQDYRGEAVDRFYFTTILGREGKRRMAFTSAFDVEGDVRWLLTSGNADILIPLRNGRYLAVLEELFLESGGKHNKFFEIDLTGRVYDQWEVTGLHHDISEMSNGNFLVLAQAEDSLMDWVVEIDRTTGAVVDTWDFREILDPDRPGTLDRPAFEALDWLHLNGVYHDERDDSLVVSARNQSVVVKIDKSTKRLKWILGPHDDWPEHLKPFLLSPVGEGFEWSWAQHQPSLLPNGDILLFDNGNFRSFDADSAVLAYRNASRGVIYRIDEEAMTVRQMWQHGRGRPEALYAPYRGGTTFDAEQDSVVICFCALLKDRFGNPMDDVNTGHGRDEIRVVEVSRSDPTEVLFDLRIHNPDVASEIGYTGYRAFTGPLYQGSGELVTSATDRTPTVN